MLGDVTTSTLTQPERFTTAYGSRFSVQTNLVTRRKPIHCDNAMIANHEGAANANFRERDYE